MPAPQSPHQAAVRARLRSLASLSEPIRHVLYRYVAGQSGPVSREQAAGGVGVAHHVAKFHLDKLEEDGLLEAEYRRPAGRTGPGAGRPAKYYRRAPGEVAVSLPERHYELPARLLAEAVLASGSSAEPVSATLRDAARATGRRWGHRAADAGGHQPGEGLVAAVCGVLEAEGYEPRATFDRITLSNCPFAGLARDFTGLVCGMNLNLMRGLVEGLTDGDIPAGGGPAGGIPAGGVLAGGGSAGGVPAEAAGGPAEPLQPRLDPAAGRCCVVLARS